MNKIDALVLRKQETQFRSGDSGGDVAILYMGTWTTTGFGYHIRDPQRSLTTSYGCVAGFELAKLLLLTYFVFGPRR